MCCGCHARPKEVGMAQPDDEKKELAQEARRLATSQGLNWKDLAREKRQELKKQVKESRRDSSKSSKAK